MCRKTSELLEAGNGVIIDHVITSERIFERLKAELASHDIRTVRVTCPPELLKKRELERVNRCPGSAEASADYLFSKDGYDLMADTGAKSPAAIAELIFEVLF